MQAKYVTLVMTLKGQRSVTPSGLLVTVTARKSSLMNEFADGGIGGLQGDSDRRLVRLILLIAGEPLPFLAGEEVI